ncbi:MAG: PAS domain S-box protein [Chloroflexi bacterium]|uniref:histidine kinase n=1 Tax=Candidatus Chlorohelix allophototropha TaxID=3003348 RepID=A0A8T7M8V2_9CHLR|nr:PAS domain S-box protein [Chloroflexota bacterium]WJW68315.1 PAS domain S-box protein [Chloroflexota bacterium L227-S17]
MAKAQILVVEDEEIVAASIKRTLMALDYSVLAMVSSGEEAVKSVTKNRPDLVLMDIILKGKMDGVETASQIHAIYDIPVIYLTAYSDDATLERAKITLPYAYILKPFDDRELKVAIELALHKSQMDHKVKKLDEWLTITVKNLGEGLIAVDMAGAITFINPTAEGLIGWKQADVLGKHLGEVVRLQYESRGLPAEALTISAITNGLFSKQDEPLTLVARDGRKLFVKMNTVPVQDEQGNISRVALVFQNITELIKSEAKFSKIFQSGPIASFISTSEGRILEVNDYALKLFGYTKEEAIGRTSFELDSLNASDIRKQWQALVRKEGYLHGVEMSLKRRDGDVLHLLGYFELIELNGENFVLSQLQDITELRKATTAQAQLAAIVEYSEDAIISKTLEGIIQTWNVGATKMYGYTAEEMIGCSINLLELPGHHAEMSSLVEALRRGERVSSYETVCLRKDGTEIDVSLTLSPVKDIYGNIIGTSVISHDITARKQAEIALQKSEERFRLVAENSSDVIWTMNIERQFTYVSPSVLYLRGYTPEEVMHQTIEEAVTPKSAEVMRQSMVSLFQDAQAGKLRRRIHQVEQPCKDGSTVWTEVSTSLMFDSAGTFKGILGITRDITERKRLETALYRSEARFQAFMDNSPTLSWMLDAAGGVRYINKSFARLIGREKEQIIGKTAFDIFPKEMAEQYQLDNLKVFENNETLEVEESYVRWDGSIGYVLTNKFPLGDSALIGGVAIDITERVRAEKALRQSEASYRLLAHNLPDSAVMVFDGDLRFLVVEGDALERDSFVTKDLEGKTLHEVLPPESVDALLPYYRAALAGIESTFETSFNERAFLVKAVPIKDEQGNILSGLILSQDITDLKRIEQSLADEKERLSVTLRSIGDAVITTDLKGNITLLNRVAEELTGWRHTEAIGQPLDMVFSLWDKETHQPRQSPLWETLNSGHVILLQNNTLLVASDGVERLIMDSCAPIRDHSSNIIGAVLVFRDVTEQLKLEQEVQKTSKLESLGVFAGGLAHDFNNLLTGITGYLDLSKYYLENSESVQIAELKDFIEQAQIATQRARELTIQLLTFSKGGHPVKQIITLPQIIEESSSFILHGTNVKAVFDLPRDLFAIEADAGQLGQVFQNLVLNSIQAMPQGGIINISAQNLRLGADTLPELGAGLYVQLSFRDGGAGIPHENLLKIFDPYFTTKKAGSGLGLAVCHSIIRQHNGHIEVESVVGKGTTFTIYLPATNQQADSAVRSHIAAVSRLTQAVTPMKILIMDDEQLLRNLVKQYLQRLGHTVAVAEEGEVAYQLYSTAFEAGQPFDVVLLDLTIPGGMGGKQTMKKLLELDPQVTGVVCSGYSNDPIMSNYMHFGFKAVLPKPYHMADLQRVLDKLSAEKSGNF